MSSENPLPDQPDANTEPDLVGLLRARAVAASHRALVMVALVSAAGIGATLKLSGGRYYLALPFVAAACFATYGLAAQRAAVKTGHAYTDYEREADSRMAMKVAEVVGIASAVAALVTFFFLVLGPSWIS